MDKVLNEITLGDFADIIGTNENDIPEECRDLFLSHNFKYRKLTPDKEEKLMKEIGFEIDSGKFNVAGKAKQPKWDAGWKENLDDFTKSNFSLDALMPKYVRPVKAMRLNSGYVAPEDPNFEFNLRSALKCYLFNKYLRGVNPIYEFGCGPAINLIPLAKMFPEKTFHGLDWVEAPKKIVDLLAEKQGWKMKGHVFDMFSPDYNFKLEKGSGVLLFSALEQLGTDFGVFLDYLIANKPEIVLHIDSLQELYDRSNPFDNLAYKFSEKRNYLTGYVTKIKELEQDGKIEILKIQRVNFGHMQYFDGYSYDVWRPL